MISYVTRYVTREGDQKKYLCKYLYQPQNMQVTKK